MKKGIIVFILLTVILSGCGNKGNDSDVLENLANSVNETKESEESGEVAEAIKADEIKISETEDKEIKDISVNSNKEIYEEFMADSIFAGGYSDDPVFGESGPCYYDIDGDNEKELIIPYMYGVCIYDIDKEGKVYCLCQGDGTVNMCRVVKYDGDVYVSFFNHGSADWEDERLCRYNGDGEVIKEISFYAEWDLGGEYLDNARCTIDGKEVSVDEYKEKSSGIKWISYEEMEEGEYPQIEEADVNTLIDGLYSKYSGVYKSNMTKIELNIYPAANGNEIGEFTLTDYTDEPGTIYTGKVYYVKEGGPTTIGMRFDESGEMSFYGDVIGELQIPGTTTMRLITGEGNEIDSVTLE